VNTSRLSSAQEWVSTHLSAHRLRASAAAAKLTTKKMLKGASLSHHNELLAPFTASHQDDIAAVQKILYRVKLYADNKNSGPVPATAQLAAMQAAVVALAEDHGALSAATVAEFGALALLAAARDNTLVRLTAAAVPALEKLLGEAAQVELNFLDLRERLMDIATLEGDLEGFRKGDRKDKPQKIAQGEGDIAAKRAKLMALLGLLSAVVKAEGDEPVPPDAADDATPESIAHALHFAVTTGVVTSLAALIEDKVLAVLPGAFGGSVKPPPPSTAFAATATTITSLASGADDAITAAATPDDANASGASEVPSVGSAANAENAAVAEAPKAAAAKRSNEIFIGAVARLVVANRAASQFKEQGPTVAERKAVEQAASDLKRAEEGQSAAAREAAEEEKHNATAEAEEEEKALAEAAAELERKEMEAEAAVAAAGAEEEDRNARAAEERISMEAEEEKNKAIADAATELPRQARASAAAKEKQLAEGAAVAEGEERTATAAAAEEDNAAAEEDAASAVEDTEVARKTAAAAAAVASKEETEPAAEANKPAANQV
jgi:hypothetical protein